MNPSEQNSSSNLLSQPKWRLALKITGFLLGFLMSAFMTFQLLFLFQVLPHGGIW